MVSEPLAAFGPAPWTHRGFHVTLLLKDAAQLAQYQKFGGVRVTEGEYLSFVKAEALVPSNRLDTKIKHLLVCCKSYATIEAILPWRQHLADDAQIVLLQNGMGSAQALQRALPKANIYCATSTDGAWRKGPFDVVRAGKGEPSLAALVTICWLLKYPTLLSTCLPSSQIMKTNQTNHRC